jgi:hypothetical protein
MDGKNNEVVIVPDYGKELEEVAAEVGCCRGKPSAASSTE